MSLQTKVIVAESVEFLVIALVLFLSAGTVAWPGAWVFFGLIFVCGLPMTWWLLKYDPGLLEERMRFRPQFSWDKVFIAAAFGF